MKFKFQKLRNIFSPGILKWKERVAARTGKAKLKPKAPVIVTGTIKKKTV